ncbi:MAG: VUT family protein [Clostridia bacterium]|nr:VUT family protein [Clostridia bacterium]
MTKIKTLFTEIKLLLRSVPSVITALFAVSVVAMNLLANKSIDTGTDWLALDCGILFSWLVFLLMDVTTKRFGVRAANILSVFALVVNLFFSAFFIAASYIPGLWSQSFVEGSEAVINVALDGTIRSSWFVILGSSVAFLASALLNNFLNMTFGKLLKDKGFLAFSVSCYASTIIAQFLDNILFAFIVSYHFFGWTPLQCVTCAATGAVAELLFEIVLSPVGYRAVKRMEKEEVGKGYLDYLAERKEGTV